MPYKTHLFQLEKEPTVLNSYSQRDSYIISHSITMQLSKAHGCHPICPFNTYLLGTYFLLQSLSLYNAFFSLLPNGPFTNGDQIKALWDNSLLSSLLKGALGGPALQ